MTFVSLLAFALAAHASTTLDLNDLNTTGTASGRLFMPTYYGGLRWTFGLASWGSVTGFPVASGGGAFLAMPEGSTLTLERSDGFDFYGFQGVGSYNWDPVQVDGYVGDTLAYTNTSGGTWYCGFTPSWSTCSLSYTGVTRIVITSSYQQSWDNIVVDVDAWPDFDADQIPDEYDNCPMRRNRDQADADADGIGDVCEGVIRR
jgi:hypothetical protein